MKAFQGQFERAGHYVAAFHYLAMEKGNKTLVCHATPIGFWGDDGGIGPYVFEDNKRRGQESNPGRGVKAKHPPRSHRTFVTPGMATG